VFFELVPGARVPAEPHIRGEATSATAGAAKKRANPTGT
jgi:hypothetical protein